MTAKQAIEAELKREQELYDGYVASGEDRQYSDGKLAGLQFALDMLETLGR
jgi:hypothetical protein